MTGTNIRSEFLADHTRLEQALAALTDAAEGASSDELIRVWREFEAGLRSHMEVEEKSMFPLIDDSDELGRLRDDHTDIRRSLDELGLAVELHSIRKESVDAFVELMRAHASREDVCLYGLADERLDTSTQTSLLERLATLIGQRLASDA